MARVTKAHLAAGTVAMLPTAATRQVNNYRFADQRKAAIRARSTSRFPYASPSERKADALAAEISSVEQTPALLIVSAMLAALPSEAITAILEQLAPGAAAGRTAHQQAVAAVKASTLMLGGQFDLLRALDRLNAES